MAVTQETQPFDSVAGQRWAWYFAHLHSLTAERRDPMFRRLEAARRFLEENLEERLTLADAARHAHLSKYHFLRLFKQTYHETPLSYLRRRRVEAAQRLLIRTELPVTAVCLHVGFDSLGSFSSLFRRLTGESPKTFRRRYIVVPRSILAPERLIPCCWLQRYGVIQPPPTLEVSGSQF